VDVPKPVNQFAQVMVKWMAGVRGQPVAVGEPVTRRPHAESECALSDSRPMKAAPRGRRVFREEQVDGSGMIRRGSKGGSVGAVS
jgi:hypothetical protein